MSFLTVLSGAGPAALDLAFHAAALSQLLTLATRGGEGTLPLPATCGAEVPGLVWPDAPTGTPSVIVTARAHRGEVTVEGVSVTQAMLRIRVSAEAAHLHTCSLCTMLTTVQDRVCSECATEYRHWITQGGTCPCCAEVRLVRRLHEGSCTGWEECVHCGYHARLDEGESAPGEAAEDTLVLSEEEAEQRLRELGWRFEQTPLCPVIVLGRGQVMTRLPPEPGATQHWYWECSSWPDEGNPPHGAHLEKAEALEQALTAYFGGAVTVRVMRASSG